MCFLFIPILGYNIYGVSMVEFWGYELRVNAASCVQDFITSREHVAEFSRALVQDIDMVAFGEPIIENFGEGNKAGFTLVQLIETSNICAHFCNESGDVYLNIFSCKPFDPAIAIECFVTFFAPVSYEHDFTYRQAPHD